MRRGTRAASSSSWCVPVQSLQLCPALTEPMDCSPPGFSVPGISQARILEWAAFPPPGDLLHPGTKPVSPVAPEWESIYNAPTENPQGAINR